jgi:transcriptional regulator with XRE-family HTH domain
MSSKLPSYLRTYRRRSGLTQAELAFLMGVASGTHVSHYERLRRGPSFVTALKFRAILGVQPEDLFPGIFAEVDEAVIKRARVLVDRMKDAPETPALKRKRAALDAILKGSTRAAK